jgi:hypothetical protein
MKLSAKTLRFVAVGLVIFLAVLVVIIVGPLRKLGEFGRAESCKGYWATLQDFVKQKGHYPKDDSEIAPFIQTAPEKEPVEYVAPRDDAIDEVVLWWKQKTMFGVRVGITESGTIVKR